MKWDRAFWTIILAGVWIAVSAAPIWSQTTPAPETDETKMKQGQGESTAEDKMGAKGAKEPGQMERKKGEEEMDARGTHKPGRMGKSGAEAMGAGGSRSERWATRDLKKAQEALKSQGHDPGSIDGVVGPQTRQAIKAFQSANGLKQTGRLDPETAEKLGVEKGTASGASSK